MKIKKSENFNLLNKNLNFSRQYLGGLKKFLYDYNYKYLRGFRFNYCIYNLTESKIYIKKIFKVIFEYNSSGKKILFLNFPESVFFLITKRFDHYFLPADLRYINVFFNKSLFVFNIFFQILRTNSYIKKKNYIKFLNEIFFINKMPELVVFYSYKSIYQGIMKKLLKLKIPAIFLINSSEKYDTSNYLYKLFGNFNTTNIFLSKVLFFLLSSVFYKKFK